MLYQIEESEKKAFKCDNIITLGNGKHYNVYKNGDPYLSVEINNLLCFSDAIIFADYLVIGNYYEGIYLVDLKDHKIENIKVAGYFGYFEVNKDVLYVLGCEDVMAFSSKLDLLWKCDTLAVDGIICDRIEDDAMILSCEMDPPGGWVTRKISLLDGHIIE